MRRKCNVCLTCCPLSISLTGRKNLYPSSASWRVTYMMFVPSWSALHCHKTPSLSPYMHLKLSPKDS